jgi:SCY1-like protein 2
MHVPPFNIPNLRIDQRKTSSAEDMARKNSTGSIRKIKYFNFKITSI